MDATKKQQYYSVFNAIYHHAKISLIVILVILQRIFNKGDTFSCIITLRC